MCHISHLYVTNFKTYIIWVFMHKTLYYLLYFMVQTSVFWVASALCTSNEIQIKPDWGNKDDYVNSLLYSTRLWCQCACSNHKVLQKTITSTSKEIFLHCLLFVVITCVHQISFSHSLSPFLPSIMPKICQHVQHYHWRHSSSSTLPVYHQIITAFFH